MTSGVAWIDARVAASAAARAFLDRLGMPPVATQRRCWNPGRGLQLDSDKRWRVPGWLGEFDDAQLIEFAKERGFRP